MSNRSERYINKEDLLTNNRLYARQRRQELEEREKELLGLQRECEEIRRELHLIDAWLNILAGTGIDRQEDCQAEMADNSMAVPLCAAPNIIDGEIRGDRLRNEIVKILEEAYPQELYYREILSRLTQKGFQVGGKNPGLNLIAHLAKEERVRRGEKRGIYCLDEAYVDRRSE